MTAAARGALLGAVAAVACVLGCGGLPPENGGDQAEGAVVIMVLEQGTNNPLTVPVTVIVGGVRGTLSPSDEQLVLRDVPLGTGTPPTQPLTATAAGYTTRALTVQLNITTATWVTVTLNPTDTSMTGTVAGIVTDLTTGGPIVNAYVQFRPANDEQAQPIAGYTDAAGNFLIGGVIAGQNLLTAQASAYLELTRNVTVVADDDGTNPDQALALVRGDTTVDITGRVVDVQTREAIQFATLTIGDAEPVVTDADGRFVVPEVPVGETTIQVTAERYEAYTGTVNVMPGLSDLLIELFQQAQEPPTMPYTLAGTVTLVGLSSNAGATVTATVIQTGQVRDTATTSVSGRYSMFIPPGRYRITVTYQGHQISTQVEIPPGGQIVEDVDFVLTIE